jgi:hypothetical protein
VEQVSSTRTSCYPYCKSSLNKKENKQETRHRGSAIKVIPSKTLANIVVGKS